MVVKRVSAEYANYCVKADLPCTPLCIYVMDNAFVTNLFILNIQSNEKGYVMRILLFCANSVLKLSVFTHDRKQCSSRVREKEASGSTNHCIFFGDFSRHGIKT